MSLFAVVEFTEEHGATAAVSSSWLRNNERYCRWPSGPSSNINKLAESHAKVESCWSLFPCKVLHKYDSYKGARKGCRKSEYTSNIETSAYETNFSKIKRRRKRISVEIPARASLPKRARLTSRSSGGSSVSSCLTFGSEPATGFNINCPTGGLLEATVQSIKNGKQS
ncbi:unnamed protein product [Orchesella dallaii]|uniref:Uncharacterized protein n=1 Tax=Orchesella dallaii TaxID=48710 RepID=A0ABP1S3V8_9HEXA